MEQETKYDLEKIKLTQKDKDNIKKKKRRKNDVLKKYITMKIRE